MTDLIQRWHLYVVDLHPRMGTKPGKQRPCLVIQPEPFGLGGLKSTVLVPSTTKVVSPAAFPLRVRLPQGICGLTQESDLMIDQMMAWDNACFKKDLGLLPEIFQQKIKQALREFLDLD